jgi:class 3 adenylate cyclase
MASTRRLAAILAADMVGYSRLMGLDEAAPWRCQLNGPRAPFCEMEDERGRRRAMRPEV